MYNIVQRLTWKSWKNSHRNRISILNSLHHYYHHHHLHQQQHNNCSDFETRFRLLNCRLLSRRRREHVRTIQLNSMESRTDKSLSAGYVATPMEQLHEFSQFFNKLEAVMFDCDGVLWLGMQPLPGAQSLVIKLRSLGKKVFFLTNNSTKTREEFLEKFNILGFQTTIDEIVGTAYLAALYLKERNFSGKAYVIGTTGITGELAKVGISTLPIGPDPIPSEMKSWSSSSLKVPALDPDVKAVVVGFDHHLSFLKLIKAASYLKNPDCLFVATNTDERFPSGAGYVLPGTGSIVNAVKTAAEREPKIMGKPHTYPFEFVQRSHNLNPSRVLMIGDRANTDIFFGKNCGLWTLLVLTGVTSMDEVEKWKNSMDPEHQMLIPHFYLEGVSNLLSLIEKYV